MQIREIHFNHDPKAGGAIPLSKGPGTGRDGPRTAITAPEWLDGVSQPVAYARGSLKGPVTIKVRFIDGPPGQRITIRAVGPLEAGLRPTGPTRTNTPMGNVEPRVVGFDRNGDSGLVTFELSDRLRQAKVDLINVTWDWQEHIAGERWRDFAKTYHYVYVTLHMPTRPWKYSLDVQSLAWVEALHLAWEWTAGASTTDECILKIATALNQHSKLTYDESGKQFVTTDMMTKVSKFQLAAFLAAIKGASSVTIDCQGIANALITFANLMGADLWRLQLEDSSGWIRTRRILPLSGPNWVLETWGWHEVAVDPQSPVSDNTGAFMPGASIVANQALVGHEGKLVKVYDANLHLNDSAPVFPIGIHLGIARSGDQQYRDLFVRTGDATKSTPFVAMPVE